MWCASLDNRRLPKRIHTQTLFLVIWGRPFRLFCGQGPSLANSIHALYQNGSLTPMCIPSPRKLFKTYTPQPQAPNQHLQEFGHSLCIFNKFPRKMCCSLCLRATTQQSLAKWLSNTWPIQIICGELLRYWLQMAEIQLKPTRGKNSVFWLMLQKIQALFWLPVTQSFYQ